MKILGKACLSIAIAGMAAFFGQAHAAEAYPSRLVRIVVPFPAGGGTTNTARLIADKLSAKWHQPVIVEERPGGNTVIGSHYVARAKPDGYTLLFINTSFTINPAVMADMPFDTRRDFKPISPVLTNRFVLLTHPSMKAANLDEFIKQLRADPGSHNLPTVGAAGIGRLANESLMRDLGVTLVNVPYKGTGELATALLGGQLQFALDLPGFYFPYIKTGQLKALAVSGETRLATLPDVPTFTEQGIKGFDMQSWYGVMAPAGTPDAIAEKLNADIQEVLKTPDFAKYVDSIQAEPFYGSRAAFTDFIKHELANNKKAAELAGIAAAP